MNAGPSFELFYESVRLTPHRVALGRAREA